MKSAAPLYRRKADSTAQDDRRRWADRRRGHDRRNDAPRTDTWHLSHWEVVRLQFITRATIAIATLLLFNFIFPAPPLYFSLTAVNVFTLVYAALVGANYLIASRNKNEEISSTEIRSTMIVDLSILGFITLNDPSMVPLTSMGWLVIVIGTGIRFGIHYLREALTGTILVATITLSTRFFLGSPTLLIDLTLLAFFFAMSLGYIYLLLSHLDRSHQQVKESSQHDPLTSLMNRSALEEAALKLLDSAQVTNRGIVVMFVDLNKFKQINDTYGHSQGDIVLRDTARILRDSIRDTDLVGRYGGDEFVIVLDDTNANNAGIVAKRIQNGVGHWSENNSIELSLSIGIGEAPEEDVNFDLLLQQVDQAMYSTKGNGARHSGGIAYVHPDMTHPERPN